MKLQTHGREAKRRRRVFVSAARGYFCSKARQWLNNLGKQQMSTPPRLPPFEKLVSYNGRTHGVHDELHRKFG